MTAHKLKLGKVVNVGFMVILIMMLSNGGTMFWVMRKATDSAFWVTHTYEVKLKLAQLDTALTSAEVGERGYIYTNDKVFIDSYNIALIKIQELQNNIVVLTRDNPSQVQRLKKISDLSSQKTEEMSRIISLHKSGKKKEALNLVMSVKNKKILDDIQACVNEMNHVEDELLIQRNEELNTIQTFAILFILGGTFVAFATGLFIYLFISRNVIRKFIVPVNEAIVAISSSSNEMLVTIEQQERAAGQQSAAANETFATITELSVSSRQSAEQAANAAIMSQQAHVATSQGKEAITQVMAVIVILKSKIAAMAEQILRLGEQTGQVGSIVTLVKDLSGQINMLALNAAVEAARAGEHGKGFAVVASEVRKLADQSKKSAEQAAALVNDIQKATNSSIMITEEGSRTVVEVTQLGQKVAEQFVNLSGVAVSVNENAQQVMLNAKQQSAAFTQLVAATNSFATGAKETVAGISQTKIGIQKLNEAAEKLKSIA